MTPDEILNALTPSLREWLPRQRWFARKDQVVDAVELQSSVWLIDGDPGVIHALVNVRQQSASETYQLLIGVSSDPSEHIDLIGRVGERDGIAAFDAATEPALASKVLDFFAERADRNGVVFTLEPGAELETGLRGRTVSAEQSNTSLIFGDMYIFKLYRRPHSGVQRDVELHRILNEAGCKHIATPVGTMHADNMVLGFLQQYLPDATDGWAAATASVRDLIAEGDLYASEVGGDFAGEAHRLGRAVAAVHTDFAHAAGSNWASPDQVAEMVRSMHARLDKVLTQVPEVAEHEHTIRAAYDELTSVPLTLQLIHGDLHLGQVLRTTTRWVLIDFEGEPAATLEDRMALGSPLRDVAGMLRSFDYAAHHLLVGEDEERGGHQREVRAAEWVARNCAALCDGYAKTGVDPREHDAALRAFELDKVVYEAAYEKLNRPGWVQIPLAALARLTNDH